MSDILGILIIVLLGFILSFATFKMLSRDLASKRWPSVSGVINRSEVIKLRPTMKSPHEFHYRPMVGYEYMVGGQTLTSKLIHASESTKEYVKPEAAQAFLVSYPLTKEVTVYYNPSKPEEACLNPEFSETTKVFAILAVFIDCLSIVAIISKLT